MKKIRRFMAVSVLVLAGLVMFSMPDVQAAETQTSSLDYSELEYQIGIANGLESYEYTTETWEVLQSAVEAGNKRLAGDVGQSELNGAAEDIELAIENLTKMDYGNLTDALDIIYEKIDENPTEHDIWYRLDKAVDKARPLLVSGDQAAVDEMAQTLNALIEELQACEKTGVQPDVIVQEVQVEVPPNDDFCNIPVHRIWLTLLVVSIVLNILFFGALMFVLIKKRGAVEHTPMVNIDFDEDIYGDINDDIYQGDIDIEDDTYQENSDDIEV